MPVRVTCPSCSAQLNVKDELAGRMVKCPKCGNTMTVPAATPDAPPDLTTPPPLPPPEPEKSPFEELGASPGAKADDEEPRRPKAKPARGEEEDRPRGRRREDDEDDRPARGGRRPARRGRDD